jgi:hypothetical protein
MHTAGAIPGVWFQNGSLLLLEQLYLYNNSLAGPLPPQLADLPRLKSLALLGNQLNGVFLLTSGNFKELYVAHAVNAWPAFQCASTVFDSANMQTDLMVQQLKMNFISRHHWVKKCCALVGLSKLGWSQIRQVCIYAALHLTRM